ncbi:MAG: helix-turn-helix domain-containing protein [Streptosporangiaceae bacterium]
MAEPLDPAALGVASALKSLRTRAGLREERLHGTELALDTLTGLDSVRALVNAGESPERAIVRAVRAAAGTLEPTMSIVVDASLSLELSADLVPDTDLYAQDLGQRREAVLRNWDQLHELRSAPPAKAPSPRALRLEVEAEALTALAMALTWGTSPAEATGARPGPNWPQAHVSSGGSEVSPAELRVFGAELTKTLRMRRKTIEKAAARLSVSPAEVTRWAAGEDLPSEPQARLLDEYLTARGAIQNLVIELLSRPDHPGLRLVPAPLPGPPAATMLQTFQNIAAALRGCLVQDAVGRPTGWPRDLRELPELPGEATPTSTAYGIKAMLLLEDGLAADLVPVADSLRKMSLRGGGYAGREQSGPRPEATAAVLNALRRVAATEDFDAHIAQMERGLGEFEKARPFILTTMLETSLLIKPGTRLVEILVDSLLAARRPYGDVLLWPEKAEPLLITPAPSVAHTARAVWVLASVEATQPSRQVQEALEQAVPWLVEQRDMHNAYEATERPVNGGLELVHIRHFTAAWVVKALVSAGVPTAHPSVANAVAQIWGSYGGDTAALWAWDNGDLPIWMTFDAIDALRLANLAVPIRPGWSSPL